MYMQQKANQIYQVCLALYAGLILSLLAETWWLNPPPGSIFGISALQILPLLLPLPGLLKRGLRAASWLCFILCFYFISGVLEAWFRPEQPQGWLITGFSVLLFITSMMFVRWQAQANRLLES
ncbi:DUF2069 domain-containing protein [Endozoicomonas sp. GU-1]|uniref:DUF2069 domain-containing protein n=2 Tax=Endozoicomonas sp. GU-1 TaxID=3009078 RepID=UPI0022B4D401|nr:DUF2069 domain-containing protein [Endozoicomonas sp. GU-1]WBA80177.1 DUF2069 domain-containing protein [Endozoicomonas sp. GU-1]